MKRLVRRLADMRLGARLALVFGLMAAAILAVVMAGMLRLDSLNTQFARTVSERHAKAGMVYGIGEEFSAMSSAVSYAVLDDNKEAIAVQVQRIERGKRAVSELLEKLGMPDENDHSEEAKALQAVHERNTGYLISLIKFMRLLDAGKQAEARSLLGSELAPRLQAASSALHQLASLESGLMEQAQRDAAQAYRDARNITLALALLAIVLSTLIAVRMARRITAPLKDAVELAGRVAAGDLTARIVAKSGDETGQLMGALALMNGGLTVTVQHVRSSSETIAAAVTELASGNRDLLARTEEQSSALEQSAASMEELASTVKQNAGNAHKAAELAREASGVANRGADVMKQVTGTMESIEAAAKRVGDIVGVIDSIAFQTNILALNAAVEAARAGEQGRGFAVVATEVRALAQRSGTAAKEIRELIGDSTTRVGGGARLVESAASTMDEIQAGIGKVNALVAEISAASREQSNGIDQVNEAIAHIEQATQRNAAMAEQSAAAMESLEQQARGLVDAVSVFKLEGAAPASVEPKRAAPPAIDLAKAAPANSLPA